MSKRATAEISCEKCGHHYEHQVYISVNSKLNPELKQRIFDNNFFKHKCKFCNHIIDSFYKVLYHNPDKKFMVWLVEPDNNNIIFMQHYSLEIAGVLENYSYHISRYPLQWIERITTLELGMDPRIIELYKFGLKDKRKLPLKSANDFLHFINYSRTIFSLGRTIFNWKIIYDSGEAKKFSKTLDVTKYQFYEKLLASIEPVLKQTSWYLVDWQFPFGMEVQDGKYIQLPKSSDFIEVGEAKIKLPSQFLEVVQRTGNGQKL